MRYILPIPHLRRNAADFGRADLNILNRTKGRLMLEILGFSPGIRREDDEALAATAAREFEVKSRSKTS